MIEAPQPASTPWRDPSPHQVRSVSVDQGVTLEVLDWGGSGRALVLLAGSGNTAHAFDEFAPRLTDCCHVYGITRRGYGASSRPLAGYDDQRLADDVFQVLERLTIPAPVLVGHSMAGGEMTTVARQHSDRLSGLVYLDAVGDLEDDPSADAEWSALQQRLPSGLIPIPRCPAIDRSSFDAYRRTFGCRMGFTLPESELRNTLDAVGDRVGAARTPDWVSRAVGQGQVFRRDYSGIHVPVLAIINAVLSTEDLLAATGYQPRTDAERMAIDRFIARSRIIMRRSTDKLTHSVPSARVIYYPLAGHYLQFTREADVLREVHRFVAALPAIPQQGGRSPT